MTKEFLYKKSYTSDLIYNSIINSYGFDVFRHYSSRMKLDILLKYIKNDSIVLDAGCANGLFSFAISSACQKVYGIDINQQFLKIASDKSKKKNIDNLEFIFGDVENIPFEDELFDCVFSYSCLVLVEDIRKAISECSRVVKKNGYIILDVTGRYNLSHHFWKNYYKHNGHFSFNALSYSDIKWVCELNQLNIIEAHGLGFLDQWKYLPLISRFSSKFSFLDKLFHAKSFDLDYYMSNFYFFKPFSNRWYIVCQKT